MKLKDKFLSRLIKIIGVSAIVFWVVMVINQADEDRKQRNQRYIASGKEAFKIGVDERANPYIDDPFLASLWLRGWMDGKRESLKAEQQ